MTKATYNLSFGHGFKAMTPALVAAVAAGDVPSFLTVQQHGKAMFSVQANYGRSEDGTPLSRVLVPVSGYYAGYDLTLDQLIEAACYLSRLVPGWREHTNIIPSYDDMQLNGAAMLRELGRSEFYATKEF